MWIVQSDRVVYGNGPWQQCAIYSSENSFTASPPFKAIASFFTSLNIKGTFSSGAYKQEAAYREMQGNPSSYQSTTQFDDWYHCSCGRRFVFNFQ